MPHTPFPVHNDNERDVRGRKCMLKWEKVQQTQRGKGMVGWWVG